MTLLEALNAANVDVEVTLHRFGGNETLLERFVRKFPSDETFSQLEQSVEEKQFDAMERAAHTLKGTSANLGFQELSDRCAALVSAIRQDSKEDAEPLFGRIAEEYHKIMELVAAIDC